MRKVSFNQIGKSGTTSHGSGSGLFLRRYPFWDLGYLRSPLSTFGSTPDIEGSTGLFLRKFRGGVQPAILDSGVYGRSIGRHFGLFKNFTKKGQSMKDRDI